MKCEHYLYNCSKEYINSFGTDLYTEVVDMVNKLSKRETQSEINNDLFWLFTNSGWSYDTLSGVSSSPPLDFQIANESQADVQKANNRDLCVTSTTLNATWHSDFAKTYNNNLIQIEVQFGKVESMFKDFCGFRIARFERRIALGIEIVMSDPNEYFAHRKSTISGMAYFDIAKKTLPAINLDCPIWLIGIKDNHPVSPS